MERLGLLLSEAKTSRMIYEDLRGATNGLLQLEDSIKWRETLIIDRFKNPKPVLANAVIALRDAPEWQGVLGFDEFALKTAPLKPAPWPGAQPNGKWTDHEDRLTADWLQHQKILVSVEIAAQAVQMVAHDHPFHPVRDYLSHLRWDGVPRLDTWLVHYLGARPSESDPDPAECDRFDEYAAAVGARWMISGVARIYKPGCKADCCLILEGQQGIKKSTMLRTLGGAWFTDEISDLGSKDSAMQASGIWLIELAELDSMSRPESSKVKAFMSRSVDRFRPSYGRRVIEFPRQCIFAGTVNHSAYLKDETGARRFWPVHCEAIRIEELCRDRDQLWAEAVARFEDGEPWWLDSKKLVEIAADEQLDRYEGDVWGTAIEEYIAGRLGSVSVSEILREALKRDLAVCGQADMNRIARTLQALGWQKYRERDGSKLQWRYRRLEAKLLNVPTL
jgi:predicted P-loop ATPase